MNEIEMIAEAIENEQEPAITLESLVMELNALTTKLTEFAGAMAVKEPEPAPEPEPEPEPEPDDEGGDE